MKKQLLILLFSAAAIVLQGADAELKNGKVILENSRMYVEIDLAQGGRISKLLDKKHKQDLAVLDNAPGGSGIFADSFLTPDTTRVDRRYEKSPYTASSIRSGRKAQVTLTSPKGLPLTVKKSISLADNADFLTADFEITNPGEKDIVSIYRSGNTFRFAGDNRYQVIFPRGRRTNSWKVPDSAPVKNHFTYTPAELKGSDIFIYHPDRGYAAVTGSKAGVVLETPFQKLDFFYSWFSHKAAGYPVVDFFTNRFLLPPLSKGVKEAVLLTVLDDPLAKYKYRFQVKLRLTDAKNFDYEKFGGASQLAKDTTFLPRYIPDTMFNGFKTPALIFSPSSPRRIPVLAVAMPQGNHEMGEFFRRFDFQYDLIDSGAGFTASPYFGWNIPAPPMVLEHLLKKNPRIILLTGQREKSLKKDLLQKLIRAVEKGAVLIYVGHRNNFPSLIKGRGKELDPELFAGKSWAKFPVKGKILEFPRGKGKVIQVGFNMGPGNGEWLREGRNLVPHYACKEDSAYWEYYFAFYGKLFNYAAGISPKAQLKELYFDQKGITAEITFPSAHYTLKAFTLQGEVCRTAATGKKISARFPAGRILGNELLMVQLLEKGKVIDYAFAEYKGAPLPQLKVAFDKEIFGKNENVSGVITANFKGRLLLTLREAHASRVIARQTVDVQKGTAAFALKRMVSSTESLYLLECAYGKYKFREYIFAKPEQLERRRIFPLIWGAHYSSWRDKLFNKELYDAGFEVFLAPIGSVKKPHEHRLEAQSVMASGMEYAPLGVEHIKAANPRNSQALCRTPCLSSPQYQEKVVKTASKVAAKMASTDSKWCFISDEITLGTYFNTPHNFCHSVHCLSEFRKVLKAQYKGDLARLNAKWGTRFPSWEKVTPPTAKDCAKLKNYAGFIAHRIFMFTRVDMICKLIADTIREKCGGETGVSGMGIQRIYQGFDLMKNSAWLKSSSFYHDSFSLNAIRASMTPDSRSGSYTDYKVRYGLWEQLISGLRAPSVWWYGHLLRRGDGTLSDEGILCKNIFRSMRDSGAMEVLGYGKRKAPRAALVWSIPSEVACAGAFYPAPVSEKLYCSNMNTWSALFTDLGLDAPDVITPDRFDSLDPERYPLVVMPLTRMLSEKQIAHLKRYVRSGGTLISDYAPGVVDQFGALLETSPLSELFGAEIAPAGAPGRGELYLGKHRLSAAIPGNPLKLYGKAVAAGALKQTVQGFSVGGIHLESSTTAVAPAVILNSYGKGKTLYLNAILPDYEFDKEEKGRALRTMARNIFILAGVDMAAAHTLPNGANYAEYSYAGVRYLFVSRRNNESSGIFELKIKGKYHIYEMLSGKYAGYGSSVKGTLKPAEIRMYCLSSRKLPDSFKSSIGCDGRRFRISFSQSGFPGTLFQIKIFHNGREVRKLGSVCAVEKGKSVVIDGGLELSGVYRIELIRIPDRKKVVKEVISKVIQKNGKDAIRKEL